MARGVHARAVAFIQQFITEHNLPPGSMLPGMRRLAALSGLSLVVIHRAVASLSQDGILRADPGRGTVVQVSNISPSSRDGGVVVSHEAQPRKKWEWLAHRLRQRLLNHQARQGADFPTVSSLQDEYGVNYRTVRKALDALCAEGHLEPFRGGFRAPERRTMARTHTIVLIAYVNEAVPLEFFSERSLVLLRELEHYCTHAQINLTLVKYGYFGGRLRAEDPSQLSALRKRSDVLGYIIWTLGMSSLDIPGLCTGLATADTRVALLDSLGRHDLVGLGGPAHPMALLGLALGRRHGELVGEYLLRKGHRKIAFVSERPGWDWSQNRLNGVRKAFRDAGLGDAVRHVEIGGSVSAEQRRERWREARLSLSPWREVHDHPNVREALVTYTNKIRTAIAQQDLAAEAMPQLEELLSDTSTTAWVCANDPVAFVCQDILAGKSIAVPDELSLTSFDNMFESSLRKLDSYDFNLSGITASLVNFITGPQRRETFGKPTRLAELDGYVVERGSVKMLH